MKSRTSPVSLCVLLCLAAIPARAAQDVWTFDNLASIGAIAPKVEGHPTVVDSPIGKAVEFNGKDDGLYFPVGPLAGAGTFTIEAIFRPEGGAEQQRWMHIAETDPATRLGVPNGLRFMFEIRVEGNSWYLDGFVNTRDGRSQALFFPDKLYPIGRWYAVEQTYDGTTYRTYVNGELQGEAVFKGFEPHGPSHVMIGARMNRVNYFHGAIAEARFTDRALWPDEFLKVPPGK